MKTIGSLEVSTPSDTEILMTRTFNAPRELVFDALTKPELLLRWFHGPDGWRLVTCEVDFRVGGQFRYVWSGPDGVSMGLSGTFTEVDRPASYAGTEKFDEAWYPGEARMQTILDDRGGSTDLRLTVSYDSKEARDMALQSGMEQGVAYGYDRMAELLDELRKGA